MDHVASPLHLSTTCCAEDFPFFDRKKLAKRFGYPLFSFLVARHGLFTIILIFVCVTTNHLCSSEYDHFASYLSSYRLLFIVVDSQVTFFTRTKMFHI